MIISYYFNVMAWGFCCLRIFKKMHSNSGRRDSFLLWLQKVFQNCIVNCNEDFWEVLGYNLGLLVSDNKTSSHQGFPYYPYRPRPGIVLDDTEYKPGGTHRQPIITRPPLGQLGDIFDITVSAIQGPGGSSTGQGKPYVIPGNLFSQKDKP
jgi:hypothetical protein